MSAIDGQGRAVNQVTEHRGKVIYRRKASMVGRNFRVIKSVTENYNYFVAFNTNYLKNQRVFADTRGRDIDELIFVLMRELDSISKIDRVKEATKNACYIYLKNGDTFLLRGFNSRLFSWTYNDKKRSTII